MVGFDDFIEDLNSAIRMLETVLQKKVQGVLPGINCRHVIYIENHIGKTTQTRTLRGMNRHITKLLQSAQSIFELTSICEKEGFINTNYENIFKVLHDIWVILNRSKFIVCTLDSSL